MEIRVTAINGNNGWAFIARGDKMFLARPPYASPDHIIGSTKRDMEHALRFNGFEQCDFTFSGLEKATRFLKEKYAEAVKARGIGLPSLNELKGLLQYASDDILLEYLERADSELIPAGKYDAARSIAGDIMALGRENLEIHNTAKRILEKCDQSKTAIGKKVTRRLKRLIAATVMSWLSRGRRPRRKRSRVYAAFGGRHERLARLMHIMIIVKAERKLTRKDLARKCEVSIRTIQRDLDTLAYAGVPIFWADDGYQIMPDFFLPPVNLSVEEALYLVIASKAFSRGKDEFQQRIIESAISKIVARLPDDTRYRLEEILDEAEEEYVDEAI
jgi:DNA-binding transcriptional ArsR family regulator